MAQRINPNILKLKISKNSFNNSHYVFLSKNNNLFEKFHEDLYLKQFIEGFFYIFNFYTSEIVINRAGNTEKFQRILSDKGSARSIGSSADRTKGSIWWSKSVDRKKIDYFRSFTFGSTGVDRLPTQGGCLDTTLLTKQRDLLDTSGGNLAGRSTVKLLLFCGREVNINSNKNSQIDHHYEYFLNISKFENLLLNYFHLNKFKFRIASEFSSDEKFIIEKKILTGRAEESARSINAFISKYNSINFIFWSLLN